jgi:hypothetical protein
MSLKPLNYVDLFDFLYPETPLEGLPDASQITVFQLNNRYAVIRNNQRSIFRALNAIVTEADEGTYFREFMLPYYEVAASKRFVLNTVELTNAQFANGFDAAGLGFAFSAPQTVFNMGNLGGELNGEMTSVLVYSGGSLLPPTAPYSGGSPGPAAGTPAVRTIQGGVILYVPTSLVSAGVPVDVVVLRTFNQKGVTWGNPAYGWTPPSVTFSAAAAAPLTLSFASLSASLGNVYDLSTYAVFLKAGADHYFRPVDPSLVASRMSDSSDGAIFTVNQAANVGDTFMLVGRSGYWDVYTAGTYDATTSGQFSIPLLEADGVTPAPVAYTQDVDVWLDGRFLRHDQDYTVDFGNVIDTTQPPRILINGMSLGVYHTVRVVSNAPWDATHNVQVEGSVLADTRGLVLVSATARDIRLMDGVGLLFASGSFCGEGAAHTVGENRGLDISALTTNTDYYYRARFCLTPAALNTCETAMEQELGMDKFLDLFGSTTGGAILAYDYQSAYALAKGLTGSTVPANGGASWPPPFGPGWFWARDRETAIVGAGYLNFDCRIRGYNPQFASWGEPVLAPGGGGVSFDGRPLQTGYTDQVLDFRQR